MLNRGRDNEDAMRALPVQRGRQSERVKQTDSVAKRRGERAYNW